MKSKKKIKKNIRSLILFGTISLLIVGYFLYLIFYYSYNIYTLNNQENSLSKQLSDLEVSEKYFKSDIEKLKDSDYIAKYARETYLYSKSGEIIIKLNDDEKIEGTEKINKYVKYIKYGLSVLGIIFIYIFIKYKKHKKDNQNWLSFIIVYFFDY